MDTLGKIEALEHQITFLIDLSVNQGDIQTTGEALSHTFHQILEQVKQIKEEVKQ